MVLITVRRCDSRGCPIARTTPTVARLARAHPVVVSLLPAHLNPAVHTVLLRPLSGLGNMAVTGSPAHGDMAWGFDAGTLVSTDRGGIHEEASSLGKRALALRETTERPEAVLAGTVRFVGTDEEAIVRSVATLLSDTAEYDRTNGPRGDPVRRRLWRRAVRPGHRFARWPQSSTGAVRTEWCRLGGLTDPA